MNYYRLTFLALSTVMVQAWIALSMLHPVVAYQYVSAAIATGWTIASIVMVRGWIKERTSETGKDAARTTPLPSKGLQEALDIALVRSVRRIFQTASSAGLQHDAINELLTSAFRWYAIELLAEDADLQFRAYQLRDLPITVYADDRGLGFITSHGGDVYSVFLARPVKGSSPDLSTTAPRGNSIDTDRELDGALAQIERAEKYIDVMLDEVLGDDRKEWSSNYGYPDAMQDVRDAMHVLRTHKDRLDWLHSTKAKDDAGYEWGVFRVKWENGRAVEVWQTNAAMDDLDAARARTVDA